MANDSVNINSNWNSELALIRDHNRIYGIERDILHQTLPSAKDHQMQLPKRFYDSHEPQISVLERRLAPGHGQIIVIRWSPKSVTRNPTIACTVIIITMKICGDQSVHIIRPQHLGGTSTWSTLLCGRSVAQWKMINYGIEMLWSKNVLNFWFAYMLQRKLS